MNGGCWENNRVAADEGELIGKAFVLKALWPGSLIKATSYVVDPPLGSTFLLAQQLSVLLRVQSWRKRIKYCTQTSMVGGVIIAASLLICSLTC